MAFGQRFSGKCPAGRKITIRISMHVTMCGSVIIIINIIIIIMLLLFIMMCCVIMVMIMFMVSLIVFVVVIIIVIIRGQEDHDARGGGQRVSRGDRPRGLSSCPLPCLRA